MLLKCSQASSFLSSRNEWETFLVEMQTEHSRFGDGSFFSFAGALTAFLIGAFGLTTAPVSTRVMVGLKDWRAGSRARPARDRGAAAARGGALAVDLRAVCVVRAVLCVAGGGVSSSSSIGLAQVPTRVTSLYSTRRSGWSRKWVEGAIMSRKFNEVVGWRWRRSVTYTPEDSRPRRDRCLPITREGYVSERTWGPLTWAWVKRLRGVGEETTSGISPLAEFRVPRERAVTAHQVLDEEKVTCNSRRRKETTAMMSNDIPSDWCTEESR
jgi:hypothetical protein